MANFSKQQSDSAVEVQGGKTAQSVSQARNWYSDRYESLVVQRNTLFLVSLVAIIATVVSSFVVLTVSTTKEIIPMLVEVEENTGFTNIVDPKTNETWTQDKALNEYFLMKYLEARETYNVASYMYNYNTVVRVLSTSQVYSDFKKQISGRNSPIAKYGSNMSTKIKVRSVQYLPDRESGDKNVQIRFQVAESSGGKFYNKIVTILYNFTKLQLTFDDRMVNPLGFQIKSYAVADDVDVKV
ncbi:MAG: type IV secretion system protein [Rickettsiales bacterium]